MRGLRALWLEFKPGLIFGLVGLFWLCRAATAQTTTWSISGTRVEKNGVPYELRGVDNMAVFGGNTKSMASWNIDIVRQCIDMKLNSISRLQQVVDDDRANGKVTILAAFWYDSNAFPGGTTPYPRCQLLSVNPSQDPRWSAVLAKWREIAAHFADQSDVWFDVWNEPYQWQGARGYSDSLWLSDMQALVGNIRGAGANNIILIPGSNEGQGETVFTTEGPTLLKSSTNILFEIHCYERWLAGPRATQDGIADRIRDVNAAGCALLIGEYGCRNSGTPPVMDVGPLLAAAVETRTPALAWCFQRQTATHTDPNCLLLPDGTLDDNNNDNYATQVYNYTNGARNGGGATGD